VDSLKDLYSRTGVLERLLVGWGFRDRNAGLTLAPSSFGRSGDSLPTAGIVPIA